MSDSLRELPTLIGDLHLQEFPFKIPIMIICVSQIHEEGIEDRMNDGFAKRRIEENERCDN